MRKMVERCSSIGAQSENGWWPIVCDVHGQIRSVSVLDPSRVQKFSRNPVHEGSCFARREATRRPHDVNGAFTFYGPVLQHNPEPTVGPLLRC